MTHARAVFRSQLREAVRDAHTPLTQTPTWRAAAPERPRRRVAIRLWLPLTPLWLILMPLALLAAPLLLLAPDMRGVRPYRAAFAIGATLFALSGTVVDVDTPAARVSLRIF